MTTLDLIAKHNIDLDWVPIGLWLHIKGETLASTKPILVRFKDPEVNHDKVKAIEVGVQRILESLPTWADAGSNYY
jgi:hypothetical protein